MAFFTQKAPGLLGSYKGSRLPPAEADTISFHKAEEMKPLTSRDKDLLTKEEMCTEPCLLVHVGYFCARNVNTESRLDGKEPCPQGEEKSKQDCCRNFP